MTKSVADAGRAMGVPVEAELGKVGGKEDDGPAVEGESPYTDPAEAKEFVERTGCMMTGDLVSSAAARTAITNSRFSTLNAPTA